MPALSGSTYDLWYGHQVAYPCRRMFMSIGNTTSQDDHEKSISWISMSMVLCLAASPSLCWSFPKMCNFASSSFCKALFRRGPELLLNNIFFFSQNIVVYIQHQWVIHSVCHVQCHRLFESETFFLFDLILKAFQQYPDTLEEIDEMIHDEKARIECQYQSNPQVNVLAMVLLTLPLSVKYFRPCAIV